jgi:hypothetical protein
MLSYSTALFAGVALSVLAIVRRMGIAAPILRTGCATLFATNRARIKIQLLSSCHALLGSEHCSRAPLSHEIEG